jgi:hypothetical protein
MAPDRESLMSWRMRLAALRAPACGMAHESIRSGPDAMPVRNPRSPSGYARAGICPEGIRLGHLGCSHTMARHLLRDALGRVPGGGHVALLCELDELENAISLLDHRRYDAETRHAQAADKGTAAQITEARRAIDGLVAEHRAYVARALALRDAALALIDAALAAE